MISSYITPETYQPRCPLCNLFSAQAGDVFCARCRTRANSAITARIVVHLLVRLAAVILVESLLGLFTGFLLFIPIGAASSQQFADHQITLIDVAGLFGGNMVLIAPIVVSLYTWTLRAWIVRAYAWSLANMLGTFILSGLMFVAVVVGGIRLGTLPDSVLTLLVLLVEFGVGIAIAHWQGSLLIGPFQQQSIWFRWSVVGWAVGCSVHLVIALVLPIQGLSLWLGTTAGYFVYGVIVHCVLAWFVLNAQLAAHIQRTQEV